MPQLQETRGGFYYGWNLGESGWNTGMDANMLRLGRFGFHLSVKDRDLAIPPGSPAAGDTYIVATGATDAWAGKEKQVAVWDGAAWQFGVPREGWHAFIEDEGFVSVYTLGAWSKGIDATPGLAVLDRDLTAPPGTPAAGDRYIVGPSATGDWTGKDGQIAEYTGTAWRFRVPAIGWVVYIVDEEKLSAYKAAGWSAGVAI